MYGSRDSGPLQLKTLLLPGCSDGMHISAECVLLIPVISCLGPPRQPAVIAASVLVTRSDCLHSNSQKLVAQMRSRECAMSDMQMRCSSFARQRLEVMSPSLHMELAIIVIIPLLRGHPQALSRPCRQQTDL